MLAKIKLLLGITDDSKDALLALMIEMAEDEATAYCNLSEYSTVLDSTVIKMVVQAYNKQGSEGLSTQSYSGASESYVDGYSADIISALNKMRRIKCL